MDRARPAVSESSFDFSSISDELYIKWLRFKWIGNLFVSGVAGFGSLLSVYFALKDQLDGSSSGRVQLDFALVAFFGVFAVLFTLVANARVRHPAIGLDIRSDKLVIRYPHKSIELRWSEPTFRLQIGQMHSATLDADLRTSFFWWSPRLFMTNEAADAVVQAAKSHGLDVRTVPDPDSSSGEGLIIRRYRSEGGTSSARPN